MQYKFTSLTDSLKALCILMIDSLNDFELTKLERKNRVHYLYAHLACLMY